MKIKNSILVISIIVIMFGGILVSKALGYWQTESNKQPKKILSGEFAGMADPEDIRGSYSFKDIENAFDVDAETIAKAFNIKEDNPDEVKAKDLESIYTNLEEDQEIGTGSIKYFISIYTGLPYGEVEYLPDTAIEVLKKAGKLNADLEEEIKDHIIEVSSMDLGTIVNDEDETEESHDEEIVVKGKTTVVEVISWGIPKEKVEEILGVTIENENMTIRDICEQNGLSFGTIKEIFNGEL